MLLETAAIVTGFGIVLFVIGLAFGRYEVAMIGAVIVIGIGGTGVVQGYQVATGEDKTISTIEQTVPLEDIGQSTLIHTKDASADDASPTGLDFSEDGGTMYVSGDENDVINVYSTADHSLTLATYEYNYSVANETTTPVGVELSGEGDRMYVTGDDTNSIHQYSLSTPWSLTTASPEATFDVSPWTTSPRAVDFNEDGTTLYVVGSSNAEIHAFSLGTPWDVTTATHENSLSVDSLDNTPTGMDFSANGTRMLVVGEEQDTVFLYNLETPYDVNTASYSGYSFDVGATASRPGSVAYEKGGTEIFVTDRFDGQLVEYDSSTTENLTSEETRKTYEDVSTISGFPLEIIVLLLGALMLIGSSGEASEAGREVPPWRRNRED